MASMIERLCMPNFLKWRLYPHHENWLQLCSQICSIQCCPDIQKTNLDMHLNSGWICIHPYLGFQFNLIFGPIHNRQIFDIIVSVCITLFRLAHLDRIDILGGHILTIQICIRFKDLVCHLRFTSCRVQVLGIRVLRIRVCKSWNTIDYLHFAANHYFL